MRYKAHARAIFAASAAALAMIAQPASATIVAEVEPNDTRATAQNIDGNFSLDSDPNITNSTTMAHSSVRAGTPGQEGPTYDWYSFTVSGAGVQGIFDIDFGEPSFDPWLTLTDSLGNVLLSQDDGGMLDPGSSSGFDPYFTYNFISGGTYFLQVGRFSGNQPVTGSYILNVSLSNGAVPEASTWAMMLLGFAGIGMAVRRRRSARTAMVAA